MSESVSIQFVVDQQDEKLRRGMKALYIGLMAFCLLSFMWTLAIGSGVDNMPPIIWYARMATVPLAIYLGKLWKNTGFRILTVYSVLFFLRCFISNTDSVGNEELAENVLSAIWLFSACYGMGQILNKKQLKSLLYVCSSLWIAGMTILSSIGIYMASTEQSIEILHDGLIGLYNRRLRIVYLATTSGSMVGITILLSFICLISGGKRLHRACFLMTLFPLFLALALTDSRTAYISVPVGIGIMAFSIAMNHFQKAETLIKNDEKRKKRWKSWTLGLLIMVIVFVLLVLIIMQITPLYNSIRIQGLIPKALAESSNEVQQSAVSTRGFEGDRVLNGRAELWTMVIDYIEEHPLILLIGESKISPLKGLNYYKAHCHSIYLQILLENGIPGLLLFLAFIGYTLIHAIRAIRDPEQPLWIRLLPAIPVSLWVGDLAENFTWLRSSQCPMPAILCIAAGILCAQASGRKNTKTSALESN